MDPDNIAYLRGLADRLMHVPVMYGTDQGDVYQLQRIANELEELNSNNPAMEE